MGYEVTKIEEFQQRKQFGDLPYPLYYILADKGGYFQIIKALGQSFNIFFFLTKDWTRPEFSTSPFQPPQKEVANKEKATNIFRIH
jgi:hypothetical protein